MKKSINIKNYESAYQELQEIVEALQQNKISIDELATKVERAGELVTFCQQKLRDTADFFEKKTR